MDMANDISKRAKRGAAAMCHTIKLTTETSLPAAYMDTIMKKHDAQMSHLMVFLQYIMCAKLMRFQSAIVSKAQSALVTFEWFLSSMSAQMRFQTAILSNA